MDREGKTWKRGVGRQSESERARGGGVRGRTGAGVEINVGPSSRREPAPQVPREWGHLRRGSEEPWSELPTLSSTSTTHIHTEVVARTFEPLAQGFIVSEIRTLVIRHWSVSTFEMKARKPGENPLDEVL